MFLRRNETADERGLTQIFRDLYISINRIKGLSEEQKLQLLKNYLENNGRITNEEARNICGVNRNQSLRLIRKLVHKGFLRIIGKGRGAYYEKC